jgi:hypothetical protein
MTKPPFRTVSLYRTHLERFEALGMHDKRLSWRASRVKQPGKRVTQGLFQGSKSERFRGM